MTERVSEAPTLDDLRARRDTILRLAGQYGAFNVRVFGSVARGDAASDSDIDLVMGFPSGTSMFDLVGLWLDLQELLGREVSLLDEAALDQPLQAKRRARCCAAMRTPRELLHDIQEQIERIERFTKPGREAFFGSEETQYAVMLAYVIVGEALKACPMNCEPGAADGLAQTEGFPRYLVHNITEFTPSGLGSIKMYLLCAQPSKPAGEQPDDEDMNDGAHEVRDLQTGGNEPRHSDRDSGARQHDAGL